MRLRFDARTRALLRRIPVVNVYSVAELGLLALLAVQVARLVWTIATPVGPVGDWRPASPQGVAPVGILGDFDPFFRLQGAAGPAVVTSLQLTLFGIRLDEAIGRGSAIIAGADNIQKSVSVGEEIEPGIKLKAVAFDHITIDRGGTDEDLFLDQSAAAAPVQPGGPSPVPPGANGGPGGGGITVGQLRGDIGFIPRIDGGRMSGLVVRPQGSGETFRRAGLREGDVVTSIGGRPVTGPQDLDRIVADFARGGSLPITVERGNAALPLAITIAAP